MSRRLTALSEEAALEQLHAAGCTDGLPVVIPTPARVGRMVLASGLDGDVSLGQLGPNLGGATVEKAAIAAAMAGCLPDYIPVVVAAVHTRGSGINRDQRRQGSDPDKVVHALSRPEALLILVAGGTGLHSTVMPSWGAGPHGNGHVTVEIDLDQACDVPL